MSIYLDISEFLINPITTGIQRIAGELCKHLPEGAVTPVRHHNGRYVSFSGELVAAVGRYFRDPSLAKEHEIRSMGNPGCATPVQLRLNDVVLCPEVIIEPSRLAFLAGMSQAELEQHRFIVYDLLPITHPEFFWATWLLEISQYYRILRRAKFCAFISEASRDDFFGRLKRTEERGGIVLPLGSDSLGVRTSGNATPRDLTFTVLGTIEPRKNHQLILEAFEPLLGSIDGLRLRFIGKMGWVDGDFTRRLTNLAADPTSGFTLEQAFGDNDILCKLRESRATIYVSVAEGYGLPPVESLWAGTPVIASKTIPSLNTLKPGGVHFIDKLDSQTLRGAVLRFINDDYANHMSREASNQPLPTWERFTSAVLDWCGG